MFAQLRELALTINNEWLMPEFSLMFAQSLKDIFTDLPEAAEQLYQDVKKLKEITKEKEKIEDEVRRQKTSGQGTGIACGTDSCSSSSQGGLLYGA